MHTYKLRAMIQTNATVRQTRSAVKDSGSAIEIILFLGGTTEAISLTWQRHIKEGVLGSALLEYTMKSDSWKLESANHPRWNRESFDTGKSITCPLKNVATRSGCAHCP